MLGLGENEDEIIDTIRDLYSTGCRILTIGQYLQPGSGYLEVVKYVTPEKFSEYRVLSLETGFSWVESGPLVRSSFHSENHLKAGEFQLY
jgi:lipoic acid synthetase